MSNTSRRTIPLPPDWDRRVRAVIRRDVSCRWPLDNGQPCGSTDHPECDHIDDPSIHELWNLRLLCRPHHRYRTAQQASAAWHAKRQPRTRPEEQHPALRRANP